MSKNKTMHEGTANKNKERQAGKCERLGCCGMENSSWEGREGRGPGGKEGKAGVTGADANVDEGEEEENDGGRAADPDRSWVALGTFSRTQKSGHAHRQALGVLIKKMPVPRFQIYFFTYIHALVTGGFNPHRRLHLESAGLWLDLQTCNLLYSIFPDVSYRMLKI
jgi:hypothetical protein